MLATSLYPSITVGCFDDFVGEVFHVLLGSVVIKSTTNETFSSVNSVFGVLYSLTLGDITDKAVILIIEGDN